LEKFKSAAYVYYRAGNVKYEEIDINGGPTDLVVKVLASARCGTDKTVYYKGHPKVDTHAPIVLGHELLGEIVYVGKKVRTLKEGIGYKEGELLSSKYLNFREGERVTFQSRIARYWNGLLLLDNPITILSFYINGGYSQYMRVPAELIQSGSVLRIHDSVTDEEAALVEPAACALESICATPHTVGMNNKGSHVFQSGIRKDGRACIIGSGSVSMIYALLCKTLGSSEVHILARSKQKAELIQQVLGKDFIIVTTQNYNDEPLDKKIEIEDEIVENLKEATGGELFDDVISACASTDAQRMMLRLYKPGGYSVGVCFGGTHSTVDRADMDQNHYRFAKTIGTSGCSNRSMERILSMLEEKKISLKGFVSQNRYTFKTTPEDFFTTGAGGLKPVLYPFE
jgi:L-iditol 2-dehydrogenase